MIFNILKQWLWCGVFHETRFFREEQFYRKASYDYKTCRVCGTWYEVE